VQNLTPYFDFLPHIHTFGGFREDLWVFTGETANAKVKSSEKKFRPKLAKFWWFSGLGSGGTKSFDF